MFCVCNQEIKELYTLRSLSRILYTLAASAIPRGFAALSSCYFVSSHLTMTIHGSINDQRDIPGSRDGNSDGSTRQRPIRTTLIRTSCKRCQKRKIRCDGAAPLCSSCNKSGNECLYEDRDRHRDSNRP